MSYCQNSYNTQQYATILSPSILLSPVLFCTLRHWTASHGTRPAALLNRSRPKSLFALYFSNQAVAAPPPAGPCVRGSPSREVIPTPVRPPPPPPHSPPPPCSPLPKQRSPLCRGDAAAAKAILGDDVGRRASVDVDRGRRLLRLPCGDEATIC